MLSPAAGPDSVSAEILRIATAGGFTPETNRRKKLRTNNALAAMNATGNGAAIKDIETHRMPPAHPRF
jgi:hypothetical protein